MAKPASRFPKAAFFLALALMASVASAADDYGYIVKKYNDSAGSLPFISNGLGGETVRVTVAGPGGDKQFGFRTYPNGIVGEYSETPYQDPTVSMDFTDQAAQELKNSTNPADAFRMQWGSGIRASGLNIFSSIKLFFYDICLAVFNLLSPPNPEVLIPAAPTPAAAGPADFSGMFSGDGVVTCADTPAAGGDDTYLQAQEQGLPRPTRQVKNNTCVPHGLVWIFENLNRTHPGMVSGNRSEEFRNVSSGLLIDENGTKVGSIPGGIAQYVNSTGKNSTIRIYGNWSKLNDTWILEINETILMATRNASVLAGGQNRSIVNSTNYTQALVSEFNEGEGVLIVFDNHAVAGVAVIDPTDGSIDVMDPAQGMLVPAQIVDDELTVYTPAGQAFRSGRIIAIIAVSPDTLR